MGKEGRESVRLTEPFHDPLHFFEPEARMTRLETQQLARLGAVEVDGVLCGVDGEEGRRKREGKHGLTRR